MRWENKLTEIFCISCALFRTTGHGSSLGPDQREHGSHAAKGNADAQSHQGSNSKRRRINRVETINLPVRQGHVYPSARPACENVSPPQEGRYTTLVMPTVPHYAAGTVMPTDDIWTG